MLSALPNGQTRKALVKEMWESGAEVMVSVLRTNYRDVDIDRFFWDMNRSLSIITLTLGSIVSRRLGNIS
jgi:hypothetical protein